MRAFVKALAAIPFLAGAAPALAQYPTQPVTLVVGFSAGGGMDTIARLVGARLSEELGQQVVVENRPGAGGTIAPGFVANARADGYTLYVGETAAMIAPVTQGDVGYDPVASFVPLGQMAVAPLALVANTATGIDSMAAFVAKVKAEPGEHFYAAPGVGTLQHLAVEQIKGALDLDLEAVQFQGGSPLLAAVLSGEVPFGVLSLNAAKAQADAGAVNVLGVTTADRVPGFEDIEAISETIPGFDGSPAQFLMAPAGTPDDVVAKLRQALAATMADEELQVSLAGRGLLPAYIDGSTFEAQLPGLIETWSATARVALGK